MATTERDIYETTFDEDVQPSANHCPERNERVTTNAAETVCDDCGLVLDDQRIDHGPEWRAFDADEHERTDAPLTAARHDLAFRPRSATASTRRATRSRAGSAASSPDSGGSTSAASGTQLPSRTSHTDWVRSVGS